MGSGRHWYLLCASGISVIPMPDKADVSVAGSGKRGIGTAEISHEMEA